MSSAPVGSIPDLLDVRTVVGPAADARAPAAVFVECPHGATRRADYDRARGQLRGPLPAELHAFFHMNTDVGSWEYGMELARELVRRDPTRSVVVARCLMPRTFIDVNRTLEAEAGDLARGGLTAAIPSYVRDEGDRRHLIAAHRAYTEAVRGLYAEVCGAGGLAVQAHTYGPVTLGISGVDDQIVEKLRAAHQPEVYATWPVRAPVDLITHTPEREALAPEGLADDLVARFAEADIAAVQNNAYTLHPSTTGAAWARAYPGQALCVEIRRDLLVPAWDPFEEMVPEPARVARVVAPLAEGVHAWLAMRGR